MAYTITPYIGGFYRQGVVSYAAYWVNDGEEVTRTDLASGDGAEVFDIYVDGDGVVYAAGYYVAGGVDIAAYWKDGQQTDLGNDARASGIAVHDGVVYVSGYIGDNAVTWKDDGAVTSRELHTESIAKATGIAVNASAVVYASGYYDVSGSNVAVYWRDDGSAITAEALHPGGYSFTEANAIHVATEVYAVGRSQEEAPGIAAASWTDDAASLTALAGDAGNAWGVARRGASTVVAGDYLDSTVRRAAVWVDGTRSELPASTAGEAAFAYGITVHGVDAYVAGVRGAGVDERAVYWKNGVLVELESEIRSRANAIIAVGAWVPEAALIEDVPDEHFQPYRTMSFRKTFVCAKCDHHFKEGEGSLIGGVPYCKRFGCLTEERLDRRRRR